MYMTEPEVDGKVGGNLEEIEWMGSTKVGTEVESQNCDNVDLGVVVDVDEDDADSDSTDGQVVSLTHHVLTIFLNLTQTF